MAILKDYLKLNIGDIVIVDDVDNIPPFVPQSFIAGMRKYSGKVATITNVIRRRNYTWSSYYINIDSGSYIWSIDMFKYVKKKGSNLLYKVRKRQDLY